MADFTKAGQIRIDRRRLERMLRLPGGLVHRTLTRRTTRVVNRAQQLAPGSMGAGIVWHIEGHGRDLSAVITSTHHATQYVINGTRPHLIRPVRAQALRFTTGGRVVFAKLVHHPGTQPNDFLSKALREAL
jgi:hypothetical protein